MFGSSQVSTLMHALSMAGMCRTTYKVSWAVLYPLELWSERPAAIYPETDDCCRMFADAEPCRAASLSHSDTFILLSAGDIEHLKIP